MLPTPYSSVQNLHSLATCTNDENEMPMETSILEVRSEVKCIQIHVPSNAIATCEANSIVIHVYIILVFMHRHQAHPLHQLLPSLLWLLFEHRKQKDQH